VVTLTFQQTGHRFGKKRLFKDVNAGCGTGITAVSGPNGSVKSTLLQIASGVLEPESGRVQWTLDGSETDRYHIRPFLGFCAPAVSLYDDLTVEENLLFLARLRGSVHETVQKQLDIWNLTGLKHLPYKRLSSGQQQRAKLAAAFHTGARLLVLDEPSTNLDATNIALLHAEIRARAQTTTILLASNDAADLALAHQTIVIA
jgi:ABC-type multidrug transport system ATPase subunit